MRRGDGRAPSPAIEYRQVGFARGTNEVIISKADVATAAKVRRWRELPPCFPF